MSYFVVSALAGISPTFYGETRNAMKIDFKKNGLVPAVVQDAETKNVLMLGFMA
ncbi:MAG: phosphoribosyl-AMP cyclohydrolase [Psychromonas sp.]